MIAGTLNRLALALAVLGTATGGDARQATLRVSRKWYDNGQLAEERSYVNGREAGVHRGFWADGRERFEYAYSEGLLDGTSREWFDTGGVWREQHYVRGHEEGLQRLYWPDGRVRASYDIVKGRRYGLMGAKGCVTRSDRTEVGQ